MNSALDNLRVSFYLFKKRHPRLVMTFVIFIIIPLVTGGILGYEMSDNVVAAIPTVVVDHDNSQFSRDYLRYIEESQSFHIIQYAEEDETVEEMMKEGEAFVGVIIPENFYSDMVTGKAPKIVNFYDGSSMSVITVAKSAMTGILMTVKYGYMMKVYEGKQSVVPSQVMNQVMPINLTVRNLFNPTKNFRNFLLPGMLAGLCQVGIAIMGAERGWEHQRKKISMLSHIKCIVGWSIMGAISIFLCLFVQYAFFHMPYKGTVLGGITLTLLFSTAITSLGYTVGSFLNDRTFATQVACIIVLPTTILGGYTWPILGMPSGFQSLSRFIPFTYFGRDVRDLCLIDLQFHHLVPSMMFFLKFIGVVFVLLFLVTRFTTHMEEEDDDWEVAD